MPYIQAIENATNTDNAQLEAFVAAEIGKLSSGGLSVNEMQQLGFTKDLIYQYAQARNQATVDETI